MMEIIQKKERDGDTTAEKSIVTDLIKMFVEIDKITGGDNKENKIFTSVYEEEYIVQSRNYFAKEAQQYFDSTSAVQYLERIRTRLREENIRNKDCAEYDTPSKIQKVILSEMVEKYKESLVKKTRFWCCNNVSQLCS